MIHVFSVGVVVDMVHSFSMMTARTALAMAVVAEPWAIFVNYLALLCISLLIGGVDKVIRN